MEGQTCEFYGRVGLFSPSPSMLNDILLLKTLFSGISRCPEGPQSGGGERTTVHNFLDCLLPQTILLFSHHQHDMSSHVL